MTLMLTFTENAQQRIADFLDQQRSEGVAALRIAGNRAEHKLWLVKPEDRHDSDRTFSAGSFDVYMDPLSAGNLEGATVDFVEGVMQSGFRVYFPSPAWDDPVAQAVQDVLDRHINPGVAGHGGSVALEGVERNAAIIRFGGGCQGCGAADMTLKHGVERMIREHVPQVERIIDATDHAAGENPYFASGEVEAESPLTE